MSFYSYLAIAIPLKEITIYYVGMAYSEDLRQRVRQYVANGGSKVEASRLFDVSRTAIYRWLNNNSPGKKPGRTKPDKLDEQALLEDVRRYSDKLLRERAKDFSMSINGIWVALKRLGIKKTLKYAERCYEKHIAYLRQL